MAWTSFSFSGRLVLPALAAFALATPHLRSQVPTQGFESPTSFSIAPGGAYVGGLALLPDGNLAVFDGTSIVELSPVDGSYIATLHTPRSPVFGAFIRVSTDGASLYFGESSSGQIWQIDLATLNFGVVARASFPYDLAYDLQGNAFISYATGLSGGSHIALVDFTTGVIDDVVDSPYQSGPIVFDSKGDLFTVATDTSVWPPPPGSATLYQFAAADIAGAIGPTVLTTANGTDLGKFDGGSYLALDEAEDLLLTDPNSGKLLQITPATGRQVEIATADPGSYLGYVEFLPGRRRAFEPWQPQDAGTLLVAETDFFSTNLLASINARRPQLATNPASPVPVGSFTFDVTEAVGSGFGFLLVAPAGSASSETALRNRGWPAPLYFGLDLSAGLLVLPLTFDASGAVSLRGVNPGLGSATIGLQLFVGAAASGPFYGSSEPFEVTFQ